MKNAALAVFGVIVTMIFILTWYTMDGKSVRQTEINNAMTSSMENAMEMLLWEEGKPLYEEEWLAMFKMSVAVQIESNSELTVHIIESDMDKGYLAAEGILTYKHPIGTTGTVSSGRMDILLEEYLIDE